MAVTLLAGAYYLDGGFHSGYVALEDGVVTEVGRTPPGKPDARGIIIPGPWNCHTHVGDAYVRPPQDITLEALVAWPDGLKHRAHRDTPAQVKVEAVREYLVGMAAAGISGLTDFREEGLAGVAMLVEASAGLPLGMNVLGRPARLPSSGKGGGDGRGGGGGDGRGGGDGHEAGGWENNIGGRGGHDTLPWREEAAALLNVCDGFGLSGMADVPHDVLSELSRMARGRGKSFAIHVSETSREDLDAALDLRPSHVVHMCHGTPADHGRLADAGVPVALCPTSNLRFGLRPDVPSMLEAGLDLALGTDNAMLGQPDLLREARTLYELGRSGGMKPEGAASILLEGPEKPLSDGDRMRLAPGYAGGVTVIEGSPDHPFRALLEGGGSARAVHVSPPARPLKDD